MNISNLFPVAQPLAIVLPNGEDTGIVFTVTGQDSREFKDTAKKWAAKQLEQSADRKKQNINIDEIEKQRIELAVACIIDWKGVQENDEDVPFSKQKCKELLSIPELSFIIDQVEQFVTERANFFRKAEKPVE